MSTLLTTVDLGNSRGKVCDWWLGDSGRAERVRCATIEGDWIERWRASERAGGSRRWIALSSVAAPAEERATSERLRELFGASFLGTPDAGLDNRCRVPEQVGRDRLFSARGAFELVGESALIVDVGTALTVNALAVEGDARPQFLGGAIAPGPRLLSEALARGTARLPQVEPRADVEPLGNDTRAAIESGIVHGLRGAARELVARIGETAGFERAPVLVTGGARGLLAGVVFGARRVDVVEDLVHIGLACAALDAADRSSSTRRHGRWAVS